MADITKCEGNGCPLKENCKRFTSKPNSLRQGYFVTPPFDKESNTCSLFWGENAERLFKQLQEIVKPSN